MKVFIKDVDSIWDQEQSTLSTGGSELFFLHLMVLVIFIIRLGLVLWKEPMILIQ